jgi:hypothetical protein
MTSKTAQLKQRVDRVVSSAVSNHLHEGLSDLVNQQFVSTLLEAALKDDDCLRLIASRSYSHYNNFDKIVLMSSVEPRYDLRLHVWWPEPKKRVTENIHNHKWDFSSVLLKGSYSFEVYEESATGREMYEYSYVTRSGSDSYQMPFLRRANLELVSEGCMSAGDSYSLPHNIMHRVICDHSTTTVSLVIRGRTKKDSASVFIYEPTEIEQLIDSPAFSVSTISKKFDRLLNLP